MKGINLAPGSAYTAASRRYWRFGVKWDVLGEDIGKLGKGIASKVNAGLYRLQFKTIDAPHLGMKAVWRLPNVATKVYTRAKEFQYRSVATQKVFRHFKKLPMAWKTGIGVGLGMLAMGIAAKAVGGLIPKKQHAYSEMSDHDTHGVYTMANREYYTDFGSQYRLANQASKRVLTDLMARMPITKFFKQEKIHLTTTLASMQSKGIPRRMTAQIRKTPAYYEEHEYFMQALFKARFTNRYADAVKAISSIKPSPVMDQTMYRIRQANRVYEETAKVNFFKASMQAGKNHRIPSARHAEMHNMLLTGGV